MEAKSKEQSAAPEPAGILASIEVFSGQLPDLSKAKPAPLPINGDYWTPKEIGEKRRMFFKEMRDEIVVDRLSGQDVELLVVYFVWPQPDGQNKVVRQAGIRLASVFDSFVKAGTIMPGMAFEITYLGKQRTTSGNSMDTWSIVPLATA